MQFFKFRLRYSKIDRAAFLGPIETLDAIRRACRAGGFKLNYSQGYHPRAKISAGGALPVGVESEAEFVDLEVMSEIQTEEVAVKLNDHLPKGIRVLDVRRLESQDESIESSQVSISYEVSGIGINLAVPITGFKSAATFPFKRIRGEKAVEVDLKGYVSELAVLRDNVLEVGLNNLRPAVKIGEVIAMICGLSETEMKSVRIRKTDVVWKKGPNAK